MQLTIWLAGLVRVRKGSMKDKQTHEKKPFFVLIFDCQESALAAANTVDAKDNKLYTTTGVKKYLIVTPWDSRKQRV